YTNELGETPPQIVAAVIQRFNALKLPNKSELRPAVLWHLHLLGNKGWFDAAGVLIGERYGNQYRAGWPLTIHGKTGTILGKLREFGLDGWRRYWAAMAIGRDLFA